MCFPESVPYELLHRSNNLLIRWKIMKRSRYTCAKKSRSNAQTGTSQRADSADRSEPAMGSAFWWSVSVSVSVSVSSALSTNENSGAYSSVETPGGGSQDNTFPYTFTPLSVTMSRLFHWKHLTTYRISKYPNVSQVRYLKFNFNSPFKSIMICVIEKFKTT